MAAKLPLQTTAFRRVDGAALRPAAPCLPALVERLA